MKIKSLLLGSAAAFAVTTGAQAADAIMAAQPEPVDYVKVCDAFGTGYFYIPGTETCLKIGGYLRFNYGFGDKEGADNNFDGKVDSAAIYERFGLKIDTNANTELGVLHTYTEIRFNYTNSPKINNSVSFGAGPSITASYGPGTNVSLNFAYVELGGFRVGKTESEFSRLSFYGNGYAGGVIDDTIVPYGPFDALQVSYTYKNGPFSAVVALEDDQWGISGDLVAGPPFTASNSDNYLPDILGGVAYNNGTFGAAVIGAYDESASDGAIKARFDAKFGKMQAFLMGAWSSGPGKVQNSALNGVVPANDPNHFANWGGDWALWGGASADLTQKISANLQLSYDDAKTFGAAGNLVFHLVPGFDATTEVDYKNVDGGPDAWGGIVRFQRNF